MASQAIEKIVERADRAVVQLKNYKRKAAMSEARITHFVEGSAGAVMAGAADAYFDEPKILGLPAVPVVSGIAAMLGMFEIIPGGEHLAAVGGGGLQYALGSLAFKKVDEWQAEEAAR
jgi:hypothetical protein